MYPTKSVSSESQLAFARAFTVAGLGTSLSSAERVRTAIVAGEPVTWRRGKRPEYWTYGLKSGREELERFEPIDSAFKLLTERHRFHGLRLVAPLRGQRIGGRSAAMIHSIIDHPGYQAAAEIASGSAGLASFVLDCSIFPDWRRAPALSWPLRIMADENVLDRLASSRAVSRGLAELLPAYRSSEAMHDAPRVLAEIVEFIEPGFQASALALRFLYRGQSPRRLLDRIGFDHLLGIEPAVFFPLEGTDPAELLTSFIYQLSHDLPVDVAAWEASRSGIRHISPLVVAPRGFLRRARVSDTIPQLQARLRHFSPEQILPVSLDDFRRFGYDFYKDLNLSRHFSIGQVVDLLDSAKTFAWDHESDAGTGLIAITHGVQALEPAPPRYTDIKIIDEHSSQLDKWRPLVAGRPYTLDVAIRTVREGLTKDRTDQPPVRIKEQVEPARVWVVVSDETAGDEKIEGKLFTFDRRFAELRLPLKGSSDGSAPFKFTPASDIRRGATHIRPRIGVRIYHRLNLIDHLELDLRVKTSDDALLSSEEHPAINVVFKHPGGNTPIESLDPTSEARALTISISKADMDTYRFAFVVGKKDTLGEPCLSGTKRLPESVLNDFVARFRDILLTTVFGPALGQICLSVNDRDELLKRLSLLGTEIVTRLFNYSAGGDFFELGEMVRDALSNTSIIQISLSKDAQDFVFPWQILTINDYTDEDKPVDPKSLWGYHFIIEVKRCGDGVDTRVEAARRRVPARVTYGRWNFTSEPDHYQRLKDIIATSKTESQLVDPIVETRADFVAALRRGGGELLYLYAHGHATAPNTPSGLKYRDSARQQIEAIIKRMESNPLALSKTQSEALQDLHQQFLQVTANDAESSLSLSKSVVSLTSLLVEMARDRRRLDDAPIVFLNTCDSAQVWNAVDSSFVGFFLDRGARAVLGSESTIPVVLADAFGRTVLEAMLTAGSSLGEAVHKARLDLLNDSRNPLGLCYCIYGAADARLVPLPA
jgi:hypothetical protein